MTLIAEGLSGMVISLAILGITVAALSFQTQPLHPKKPKTLKTLNPKNP